MKLHTRKIAKANIQMYVEHIRLLNVHSSNDNGVRGNFLSRPLEFAKTLSIYGIIVFVSNMFLCVNLI